MSYLLTLRIALRALAKNKLRAGLTVLGVVIGIAAVTAMVSLGQSASDLVQGQFTMLGTNVIFVFPGNVRRGVLEVLVSNSSVLQELSFLKPKAIKTLTRLVPEQQIKGVRFRVGPIDPTPEPEALPRGRP